MWSFSAPLRVDQRRVYQLRLLLRFRSGFRELKAFLIYDVKAEAFRVVQKRCSIEKSFGISTLRRVTLKTAYTIRLARFEGFSVKGILELCEDVTGNLAFAYEQRASLTKKKGRNKSILPHLFKRRYGIEN